MLFNSMVLVLKTVSPQYQNNYWLLLSSHYDIEVDLYFLNLQNRKFLQWQLGLFKWLKLIPISYGNKIGSNLEQFFCKYLSWREICLGSMFWLAAVFTTQLRDFRHSAVNLVKSWLLLIFKISILTLFAWWEDELSLFKYKVPLCDGNGGGILNNYYAAACCIWLYRALHKMHGTGLILIHRASLTR